ncbi:MAG: translocation/assembly module TamB domain-containing protein [Alistipes sp.]|jgi:autotransporter translocation and assembly factor TamB|nr:translocation/assembly module TamB domain-containing protein [Alistipes sp.]
MSVFGKIIKVMGWTLLGLFATVLLCCVAVYLPAVQRFAIELGTVAVARSTGWHVRVERFRLRFPLGISVRDVTVVTPVGDTLAGLSRARIHAALLPLLRGRVRVSDIAFEAGRITWRDTLSGMVLRVQFDDLAAGTAMIDLALRTVSLSRVSADDGEVELTLGTSDSASTDTLSPDWTIDISRVGLSNFAFILDPDKIRTTDISITARDFNLHGEDLSVRVEELRLSERPGFRITSVSGDVTMRDGAFLLSDVALETVSSRIKGDFAMELSDAAPTAIRTNVSARIDPAEVALFAPLPEPFGHLAAGRMFSLEGTVSGTLEDLNIERLDLELPPMIALTIRGTLRGATTPETLAGRIALEGRMDDARPLRALIADTALRRRVAIPRRITFSAGVNLSHTRYDLTSFTLRPGTGRLDARGSYDTSRGSYDARVQMNAFPLSMFLPRDSLGVATLALSVRGRGFDPRTMEGAAQFTVDRLDFGRNDLGPVSASLTASGGTIAATVASRSDLLATDVDLEARVEGQSTINYNVKARIDTTRVRLGGERYTIVPAEAEISASAEGTRATVRSGDLAVGLVSPMQPDSLVREAARTGGEITRQLSARHLSIDSLRSALPPMVMAARGGRDNFLHDLAALRGIDYEDFMIGVTTLPEEPLTLDAQVTGLASGNLEVDTLTLAAQQNGDVLDYEARFENIPVSGIPGVSANSLHSATDFSLIGVSGGAEGRSLTANVVQRNTAGETGFDFGLRASLLDSGAIRAELDQCLILGYERWRVGSDWVEYDPGGALRADLSLATTDSLTKRHLALTSASLPSIPEGALRLVAEGLNLEPMLDLLPIALPVGGIVSSDLTFGLHPNGAGGTVIAAKGNLGVKDFAYSGRRLADIDATVDLGSDASGRMTLYASVELEKRTALTSRGTYEAGSVDLTVDVPALPIALAEGFLPAGTATLDGTLDGQFHIIGSTSKPAIIGDVGFTDAGITLAMTGTRLGISTERVAIAGNRVTLADFGLTAPNDRRLTLTGNVDIADLAAPTADLVVEARDFQFVNSTHIGGSQVYGRASLDAAITARGPLDALRVRGNVVLSEDTDMVYIVRDDREQVRDERQHIVRFVSLAADSLATVTTAATPATPRRRVGIDMLVSIDIGDGLRATLSLDELNENRIELTGGGDLAFSMNPQGDTRLTGRYTMTGGTLYYRPPLIPQKIFFVSDGSYIEWTGPAADPRMNITATQTMDVTLESEGGDSRQVPFDITVSVAGSLASGVDMTFDLDAPSDIDIENELLQMTPEAKMQQAVSLLAFNRYTGEAYSSARNGFDARRQLGEFVEREINQWARNNLRGVDFQMGIRSATDPWSGTTGTDYSYNISKSLFSDRVKVSIGGHVSDVGGYGMGGAGGLAETLLEDVTLEYRLTRRDNMFLKLFRYNTRESILEGEVTETGSGFVLRRKLNRFGDMFRRTRPKRVESEKE